MPEFLTKEQLAFLDQGGDPNDPNYPVNLELSSPEPSKDVPPDPNKPPADPGELFEIIRKGEKEQHDKASILKYAQQGRDYEEKMKTFNGQVRESAEQIIGQMIREGKLKTTDLEERTGPEGPGLVGPQPTGQYPSGYPAPTGYQPQVQPQFGPGYDQSGYPEQQQQQGYHPGFNQPDPRIEALNRTVSDLRGVVSQMSDEKDKDAVDVQRRRFDSLMREAKSQFNMLDDRHVILEILQHPDPDSLSDSQIIDMCKRSHNIRQADYDAYMATYSARKIQAAKNLPAGVAPRGRDIKLPEKPLKNFSESRLAAMEYLKAIDEEE